MIIRRVEMEGVRCFSNPVRVEMGQDAFTIISGPNGSGKSTFLDAMSRGLLDLHTTSSAASLCSWSDSRPPCITIEFDHAGITYRLAKQFVSKKSSRLEQKQGRSWKVVEQGREADNRIREMLRCGARNDAGLLSVLWSPQGKLPLEQLPGGILEDIRAALGAQMAGNRGAAFEKQLRKNFEAAWQPIRKQPKRGRLHDIDEKLEKLNLDAAAARSVLEEADEHGRQAETLREKSGRLRGELRKLEGEVQEVATIAGEVAEFRRRAEELGREHKSAGDLYQALWHRIEQIRTESERRHQFAASIPGFMAAIEENRTRLAEANQRADRAQKALSGAIQSDPTVEGADARANRAALWTDLTRRQTTLRDKLDKLTKNRQAETDVRQNLQDLHAPDPATMQRIREASERLREAQVWLEKLQLRLELTAEKALEIEVNEGTPQGRATLAGGTAFAVHGTDELAIRLAGIASLRMSGPQTENSKWRTQAEDAERTMRDLCRPFGDVDSTILAEHTERRKALEADLSHLAKARAELIDQGSETQLAADLASLAAKRMEIDTIEPEWGLAAPDPAILRAEVDKLRAARESLLRGLQQESTAAEKNRSSVQAVLQSSESAMEMTKTQLQDCDRRLRELEGDGKTGDQRRQELEEVLHRRDVAEKSLQEVRLRLAALPQDAEQHLERLEMERRQNQELFDRTERDLVEREASRRTLLARGPYSNLSECEEEIERLDGERKQEVLRLDAIRRLWETYEAEKAAALDGIAEPVADRATKILAEIAGTHVAALKLSADFSETEITPADAGRVAVIDEMSGGEKEQIELSVRLALAEHLTVSERHLVVFDDVLLNTDDDRLERILRLLEERKNQMQIVILTCHPERYACLRGARHVVFPPPAVMATSAG